MQSRESNGEETSAASVATERAWESKSAQLVGPLRGGDTLDRYVILEVLGSGGMGVVYRAFDPRLHRDVALKVTRPIGESDKDAGDRLVREAHALARLSHPHVINVFDAGTDGREVFIAMELAEGETLRQWLEKRRSLDEILDRFLAAGEGVEAAHAMGIVHRDFKPDNVIVGRDGRVRVVDFGIARLGRLAESDAQGTSASSTTARAGTPRYMAPEQWTLKTVDARADQFSFCVSLFEALVGEHPFAKAPEGELRVLCTGGMPPMPAGLPRRAKRALLAIRAGFDASPEQRFPSMGALLSALRRVRGRGRTRLVRSLMIVLLLCAAAWTSALGLVTLRQAPCVRLGRDRVTLWSDEERRALVTRLRGLGATPSQIEGLEARIDFELDQVAKAKRENCLDARVRSLQSDELMDLRARCLLGYENGLRDIVEALRGTDGPFVLARVSDAFDQLPPLAFCTDGASLRRVMPLPRTDSLRTVVVEAQRAAEQLGVERILEPTARTTLSRAQELVKKARALEHPPLLATALVIRAQALGDAGRFDEAASDLDEAASAAVAAGDDQTLARIWVLAVGLASARGLIERVKALDVVARGAIARLGGHSALETELDLAVAGALRARGAYAEARARVGAALARHGTSERFRMARARALSASAQLETDDGDPLRAIPLFEEALTLVESSRGQVHPERARIKNDLALTLRALGRFDAAETAARDALSIYEETHPNAALQRAAPLNTLGLIALDRGRFEEALDRFEAALRLWRDAGLGQDARFAVTLGNAARAAEGLGRTRVAERFARQAVEVLTLAGQDASAIAATLRAAWAQTLAGIGKPREAAFEARRARTLVLAHVLSPKVRGALLVALERVLGSEARSR